MSKQISEAARKLRNEYQKNWRKNNPDKVRAANDRYWERKAQKLEQEGGRDNVTV